MKTIYRIILTLSLTGLGIFQLFSQSSWVSQTSGVNADLYDIQFLNANTGFASGENGTLLRTTNSGLFWNQLQTNISERIARIAFIDVNTGWILTQGNPGAIIKTTNGGMNFSTQNNINSSPNDLIDINVIDFNNVYVSTFSIIRKTTDGGSTWTNTNPVSGYSRISFLNSLTGYALTTDGFVCRTSNGGVNWSVNFIQNLTNQAVLMTFYNNSTGYITDKSQRLYKTNNGGNNWQSFTIVNNTSYDILRGFFYDLNTGWITSYAPDSNRGLVYKTFNGGVNWGQQYVGTDQQIRAINFIDANTGWIAGYNGIIYKTTNGGGDPIGIQQISNEVPKNYNLSQNFPNPFNPQTSISFELSHKSFVKLIVYDLTGKEIIDLTNQSLNPGKYLVSWDAGNFPSGTYFYKLETTDFIQTKKMVLIK